MSNKKPKTDEIPLTGISPASLSDQCLRFVYQELLLPEDKTRHSFLYLKEWAWMGHPRMSPTGLGDIGDCYMRISGRWRDGYLHGKTYVWHYCSGEDSECCHMWWDEKTICSEAVECVGDTIWEYRAKEKKNNNFVVVIDYNHGEIRGHKKYMAEVYPKPTKEDYLTHAILRLATRPPDPRIQVSLQVYAGGHGIPAIVEVDSNLWRCVVNE